MQQRHLFKATKIQDELTKADHQKIYLSYDPAKDSLEVVDQGLTSLMLKEQQIANN